MISIFRSFFVSALLLAAGTLLIATPAQALHECGAEDGKSHGHDHDHKHKSKSKSKKNKSKKHGKSDKMSKGCEKVLETDFINGDARIDAPELAARGEFSVGVRNISVTNYDQIDILQRSASNPYPKYDRKLELEIWYPAQLGKRDHELTSYHDVLGSGPDDADRPLRPFEFAGRSARNAMPYLGQSPYPLIIVSHGYPGSRVLLTYLTENLASKGYVVVAIDHTESTHADKVGFHSTLLNRSRDVNFVLDNIANQSAQGRDFLSGMVDADRTTVIGYSMGGYGALNAAGAGYNPQSPLWGFFGMNDLIASQTEGSDDYPAFLDPRIRALVAFAPWGGSFGTFTPTGMAGIEIPSLFISGKQDETSGYDNIESFFKNAVNSDRYLLAYESAIHEVAVNPPPPLAGLYYREFGHYQEPAWDNRRLNNINQHFITAFLGKYIKADNEQFGPYLNLIQPISNLSSRNDEKEPSYWKGFPNYSAIGMEFHHLPQYALPD